MVYIDSCIFLNVIKREASYWSDSLKLLLAAERGDIEIVASTLVLAEVASHKGDVDPAKRDEIIERYLTAAPVLWYELDLFVVDDTRRICDEYKMSGADAAHMATAVRAKAEYLVSNDKRFPYGQAVGGVRIIRPMVLWDATIDDVHVDQEAAVSP
ncbi:type II toxin-antitoxin system VapC family toxin [Salinispora mooreana]|uniref:type II toxin-antitoxin system VapC family toxin n=1 Tax=Salinispora mooreana TaxID=999545 RepID=UPI0013A53CFF|nr:type II toxin-antitoxin system VapC family toxin [Salinispora mooreana]